MSSDNNNQLIDFLAEFVSLASISSDPARKQQCINTANFLENELRIMGIETQIVEGIIGKNPLVLGKIGVEANLPTILIYGHYDVQPAALSDGWDTEPFDLTEKNGYLYGRGATDDKGPITSTLFAIKELIESGDIPVNLRFVYEGEEESGSEGFEAGILANLDFIGKVDGIVVIDNYWLGTDRPCLTYGLRGMAYMSLEVTGPKQDQHSGVEGGTFREPIYDLIQVLSKLSNSDGTANIDGFYAKVRPVTTEEEDLYEAINFDLDTYMENLGVSALQKDNSKELLMNKWRHPTISIHGMEGAFSGPGSKTVIPSKITAKVSMRLVPDQDPEEIAELFIKTTDSLFTELNSPNSIHTTMINKGEWWVGDPDNFLFKAAEDAIVKIWEQKPLFTREGGSIPIVPFMENTLKAPAMMISIGQSTDSAHSQNEKIRILNLINGKNVIREFIRNLNSE